jgi:ubiquinone/menaquinone biosynthesis C-methylase UbiE
MLLLIYSIFTNRSRMTKRRRVENNPPILHALGELVINVLKEINKTDFIIKNAGVTMPTPEKIDREYLANQYRDARNLDARIRLHQKFSTNPYGWFRWVFDRLDLSARCRILELGCGAGSLWMENLDRIPAGWEILLSDFSAGMIQQAQHNLRQRASFLSGLPELVEGRFDRLSAPDDFARPTLERPAFNFEVIDAQSTPLPFEGGRFDCVIANHMLYYIPGKPALFAEIRRILRPGGRFYATTIGERHLVELSELIQKFEPASEDWEAATASFTLENGTDQLSPWFSRINLRRYEDSLVVNEAKPLVDYILSGWESLTGDRLEQLRQLVDQEMELQGGVFTITKDSGIFDAII